MSAGVEVVVCIDTEGPVVDPANPELLDTWHAVDRAMDTLFDPAVRTRHPDSVGGGLRFGWFFLTWAGFRTNPRGRDFGYHRVRDHYLQRYGDDLGGLGDEQCWHYHQPPASGVGNEWSADWESSREYDQILSRQLLERDWWPTCFRAGGTIMDAVSSRWVDTWFPLDYSNRAPHAVPGYVDWSGGSEEWSLYHPSTEDFRLPGAGRRRMARCLDLVTGVHVLDEDDVEAAFAAARAGRPAILACFDHDYRDIAPRLDELGALVTSVAARFPEVPWRYAAPTGAALRYLDAPADPPLELDASFHDGELHVWSSAPLFQSLPWLAVATDDGGVLHVEQGLLRLDATRWRWTPPPGLDWTEAAVGGSTDLGSAAVARATRQTGPGGAFLGRPTGVHPTRPRSIWEHSKLFIELAVARASGDAEEQDAAHQAAEYLAPRLEPGMSVLDAGAAAGHLWRSLSGLGVEYHGIDAARRAIEIGRAHLASQGLPAARLRPLAIEDLPPGERYDAVVSLSTLLYLPMFHLPLEAMARAATRWLVVRSSFGDETTVRYLPDVLLEPGFQSLCSYFNIYGRAEVQELLEREGFQVTWVEDERQRDRYGRSPEVVGGIEIPYEFLMAERVAPPPDEAAVLADLAPVAERWTRSRREPR